MGSSPTSRHVYNSVDDTPYRTIEIYVVVEFRSIEHSIALIAHYPLPMELDSHTTSYLSTHSTNQLSKDYYYAI